MAPMADLLFNLLEEPLLGLRLPAGERLGVSLPDLLARLGRGDELELTALQPHQFHAWHAFLCQLAALALHSESRSSVAQDEATWRHQLLGLTDGDPAPWSLIVPDLGRPAFMQPPVPEGTLKGFKNHLRTPDELDLLVTTRNHEVKARRIHAPQPEHWIFALASLQTMGGFLGAGNYGISRMNGGFANRPCVTLAPSLGWSARFRRDVAVLLEGREGVAEEIGLARVNGRHLLWLEPWNGKDSIALTACDPFYIEICRRLRLVVIGDTIVALATTTMAPRVAAQERHGDTGDPWTPLRRKDGAAFTAGPRGFSYNVTQELLFGADYRPGAALRPSPDDGDEALFLGTALVRGQGKTEGLHERILPVPAPVRSLLLSSAGRTQLATLAKRRVEIAADVRTKVLKSALCVLLQADPDKLNTKMAALPRGSYASTEMSTRPSSPTSGRR